MNNNQNPPTDERDRELWMQHAAGAIIFKDMREYAMDQISPELDDVTKEHVIKGIDDAIYGYMMIMDGATGQVRKGDHRLSIETNIVLGKNDRVVQRLNVFNGDGMCMGFHGWKEGDFGDEPIGDIL